jgi:hypothetical protein
LERGKSFHQTTPVQQHIYCKHTKLPQVHVFKLHSTHKWQSTQLLQNLIKDVETLGAGANESQSFAASFIVSG